MKKAIYLLGIVLLSGTFSSFKATTFAEKKTSQNVLKFKTQVAGYFTRNGIDYEVWVEYDSSGFGTVTDVFDYNNVRGGIPVDGFSGTIDPSGVLRVSVSYGSENFYYSGHPRSTY
jgi:hypothetical protein